VEDGAKSLTMSLTSDTNMLVPVSVDACNLSIQEAEARGS
jgi:hypothetical protein